MSAEGELVGDAPVGRRVRVYWKNDAAWYSGEVTAKNGAGKHLVEYDDGEEEWVNLSKERVELLPVGSTKGRAQRALILLRFWTLIQNNELLNKDKQ